MAYRSELEARVTADLNAYAKTTSAELVKHLDHFLEAHKDRIKDLLHATQDVNTTRDLGADLEKELLEYLKEPSIDLTHRVSAGFKADAIELPQLSLPKGAHHFRVSVKDSEGRATTSTLSLNAK